MRDPFVLPELLVIAEDERLVPLDRPARRAAVLVAPEVRSLGVEEVARIERAVPQELEHRAMKLVGARLEDRRDHAAGRPAVFGGVLAGQDAEFANSLDAEIYVQAAARARIREVVDDEPVDEKDVAGRSISGDRQSQPVASRGARIREGRCGLLPDAALDAGFERRELQPIAAVQRQL